MKDQIKTKLEFVIFKENKMYVAYCLPLDLATCGRTQKESIKNMTEAIELFFEETILRNTFEEALLELGWKKQRQPYQWIPPQIIAQKNITVNIPKSITV